MTVPEVDPRTVSIADVYKADRLAARLTRSGSAVEFRYQPEYLAAPGRAVATTLPVSDEPVHTSSGSVPAYFAGLLPEGRRLTALRQRIKTSLDDEFSLLVAIGSDASGDVVIVPSGHLPEHTMPAVRWDGAGGGLSFAQLAADAGRNERRGIAGVQDKASAAMITLPALDRGRDAILKLNPPEYAHLVENEAYFLAAARHAGLLIPAFSLVHDERGDAGLLVERFDRCEPPSTHYGDGQQLHRLAMEDAGQVLGIYPAAKYTVTAEDASRALIAHCQARPVAARDLFRQWVFAWLTGNGDMHAKNIAILHSGGEWRISPAFDLPSSLPYGDTTMALSLDGRFHDLSRRSFLNFADAIGLPARAASTALDELLESTQRVLDDWQEQREPFMRLRQQTCVAQLRYRRRLLTA